MLKERAERFYMEDNCNCAEALLLAANEEYGLGLPDGACKLVGGFGGGIGCGSTCGALLGAVSALGAMKMGRRGHESEGFKESCADLVQAFREKLGSDLCQEIKPRMATEEQRCRCTVLAACQVLEEHLSREG